MNKLQIKLLVIGVVVAVSIYLLYSSIKWFVFLSNETRKELELKRDPIVNRIINLGLDLKGGSHLILEVDTGKLPAEMELADAVNRAIEVIRNRVDQFGVTEPLIAKQGDRWIVVQLPGVKDPKRAKELIGKMALLEFRLVDDSVAINDIVEKIKTKNMSISKLQEINKDPDIQKLLPKGYELFAGRDDRYYLLKSTPELTGAYLVNARVELGGDFGFPYVSLEFNSEGAKIFADVTAANIEKNLAIVLDGVVQSAPVIKTRIPDGRAIIEGNFLEEDAKLLATVLRAGALPAPVKIIEERTVGPTLGEDSIKAGVISAIIGGLLVIIFMILYYRISGFIADVALFLNFTILLAIMAYFRFTLTLPGIAGIILILGMAVDANVLILERVREELALGKTVRVAIDAGYSKALTTIIDSNITTLVAALFLFQFGTGPIKGFAVTLSLGILISMFSAIFVTKVIYDMAFFRGYLKELRY